MLGVAVGRRLPFFALFVLSGGYGVREAHAFPEFVRHGYANCTTCHLSPGGGGVLSAYGREISRELLSQAGHEGEGAFAWGLAPKPEWLEATFLARGLQVVQDSATSVVGRAVLMQADAELAVQQDRWAAVASLGYQDPQGGTRGAGVSRRHFGLFRATDELSVRAGRFYPVYGLMPADHRLGIRTGLGWDQGQESYNLEAAWIGERFSLVATGILGNSSTSAVRGAALSADWFQSQKYKFGASFLSTAERLAVGPHVALGFSPRLFYLGEVAVQDRSGAVGFFQYQKLSYELVQGLHFFGVQELARPNVKDSATLSYQFGPGFQWFPRPHFEVQLSWHWVRFPGNPALDGGLGLGMLNFYL